MAQPQERLFRDEGGAALERVAQLEEENRALRGEIARIKRPPVAETLVSNGQAPRRANRETLWFGVGLAALLVGSVVFAKVRRDAAAERRALEAPTEPVVFQPKTPPAR